MVGRCVMILYAMLGRCATNSRYVMNGEQRREASELERCHRRLGATRQDIHGCCCCCCSLINRLFSLSDSLSRPSTTIKLHV